MTANAAALAVEPAGARYGVVLADPPWSYSNAGVRGSAANHYPTMDDAAICALPVGELADRDAVLFLWATWPRLTAALEVIDAWGFRYVTGLPWIKVSAVAGDGDLFDSSVNFDVRYGIGHWARGASEPLLIARRGAVSPATGGLIGLLSPNLRHSRKPDSVYAFAESYPGPWLELFARRPRAGWHSWGNEVASDVTL